MAGAIVYCDLPSGLHLACGPQNKPQVRLTLRKGRNDLDEAQAALWSQWLADHSESSLVLDRRVYEETPAGPAATPAAAAAKQAPQPTAAAPKE